MTAAEVLSELEELGNEGTRKTLLRHGARDPLFGVKVGDLKKLQKKIGLNHSLALELFESGNYDAMYLACLVTEDEKMTKQQLQKWARNAYGGSLSEATVPWVASGSPHGFDLALEWIDSRKENVVTVGWSTLSSIASVCPDENIKLSDWKRLLGRVKKEIQSAPNDVCYSMNGFVIAVGSFVEALYETALATAEDIGPVTVDHGETACQTPFAPDYLRKVASAGRVGKKKKTAKC